MRQLTAKMIAPILRVTGYRFSRHYRWGTTLGHRAVYALVDTVAANHSAGLAFDSRCNIFTAER